MSRSGPQAHTRTVFIVNHNFISQSGRLVEREVGFYIFPARSSNSHTKRLLPNLFMTMGLHSDTTRTVNQTFRWYLEHAARLQPTLVKIEHEDLSVPDVCYGLYEPNHALSERKVFEVIVEITSVDP